MPDKTPEKMAQEVVEACADCDICRYLMEDTPCLLFPELYRLYDKANEGKERITSKELKNLIELCNFCALCPCPNIRSDIMKAKHAFVERDGLSRAIRLLEDVERLAKVCGAYPRLTNMLFKNEHAGGLLKQLTGIHQERNIPVFPAESFRIWAQRVRLHRMRATKSKKVAYFAGCTGLYLFPETPKAVVEVLHKNNIEVYYPEQKCCGMPSLLEGDRRLTLDFARYNVDRFSEVVRAGYDIVCSCPTCGYMFKHVLSEGAIDASEVVEETETKRGAPGGEALRGLFKDEGYFATIDPRKRIKIALHTYDLGEYLLELSRTGELNRDFKPIESRTVYYPPCHLREQNIGEPYVDLLNFIPGISLEKISGSFYCCGIAGIMGFKRDFHEVSIEIGRGLMDKVKMIDPETLATDCLSCRLQFNQLTPYRVLHPIEIVKEAYA